MTREYVLDRATKNYYLYTQVQGGDNTLIGFPGIYILRENLPTKPQRIRITLEEVPVNG